MGRWCTAEQLSILERMLSRLAEGDKGSSGTVLWLNLGWYPTLYLMYSAGVAALSADNYTTLARILTTPVHAEPHDGSELQPLVRTCDQATLPRSWMSSNGYPAMSATTWLAVNICARNSNR